MLARFSNNMTSKHCIAVQDAFKKIPDSIPNSIDVGAMSSMSKQCCTGGQYRNDADQIWNAIWDRPIIYNEQYTVAILMAPNKFHIDI